MTGGNMKKETNYKNKYLLYKYKYLELQKKLN